MSERTSATIIAFPRMKAAPPPALPADPDPQARLQRALTALDIAVAEQRTAVAKWRESLGELRGSMHGLGQSLGAYNARLGLLADDVGGLNLEARRMEAWADGVLGTEGDKA
jgi:hypothetical protein